MVDRKDRKCENKTIKMMVLTEGLTFSLSCYYLAITWVKVGFLQILAAGVSY